MKTISLTQILLIFLVLIITAIPFFIATNYVDLSNPGIAFDWKASFHGAFWLKNFGWDTRPFRTPPWSIPFFLPITALSFNTSWSLMMYFTTLMIVAAMPRPRSTRLWIAGILLLAIAYPTVRNYIDVNLEAYVILGVLLTLYAYNNKRPLLLGVAVLIATIKPQSVFLLMIVLGIYILQSFQRKDILKFGLLVAIIFGITMLLWAKAWLGSVDSMHGGISLKAGLDSMSLPTFLVVFVQITIAIVTLLIALQGDKQLSRMKAGLLITASVMVAPYANGTSLMSILAIAVTALFIKRPLLGLLIFIIYSLPYTNILGTTLLDSPVFWMFALLLVWVIFVREVYLERIRPTEPEADNQLLYSDAT